MEIVLPSNNNISFRDPDGYIFKYNNEIYRNINICYKENYDFLMKSGLYEKLIELKLLIPHIECFIDSNKNSVHYKTLKPEMLDVIVYPFELSFNQLKDFAITTLEIIKISLEFGMILKDASAFNIQFYKGTPVLIDTLSFEKYIDNKPWKAYSQFCKHFICPLLAMKYTDTRINKLTQSFADGIPIDLASKLLSKKTYFNFLALFHIHINSFFSKFSGNDSSKKEDKYKISKFSLISMIDSIKKGIMNTEHKISGEWNKYYKTNDYSAEEFSKKERCFRDMLNLIKFDASTALDIGANTGFFSRIAANAGIFTVAIDNDSDCVDENYIQTRKNKIENLIPLNLDVINMYSRSGLEGKEHLPLTERFNPDLIIALAVIHHIRIAQVVPFVSIAKFFSGICRYLIIEFVQKSDLQVLSLLKLKREIYDDYSQAEFERIFLQYFTIIRAEKITLAGRTLYLMKKIDESI